jgi:hypothetical protein
MSLFIVDAIDTHSTTRHATITSFTTEHAAKGAKIVRCRKSNHDGYIPISVSLFVLYPYHNQRATLSLGLSPTQLRGRTPRTPDFQAPHLGRASRCERSRRPVSRNEPRHARHHSRRRCGEAGVARRVTGNHLRTRGSSSLCNLGDIFIETLTLFFISSFRLVSCDTVII